MYTTVTFMGRDVTANAEAVGYRMHPSVMARRTYVYFHESDVEDDCGRCPAESASYLNEKQAVESALKESTGSGGLTAIGMKGLMD